MKYTGIIVLMLALLFFICNLLFPLNAKVAYSAVVEARDGTVLHAWLAKDEQWRIQASLDEISPELKQAFIYKEDKYFYSHPGVNALAIIRAAINNTFHLKRTSGASTITMQVVKLLDPKERTYFNKCIEIFRALQLELHYSKDEILQLYFNLLPYGGNIQGVKAASLLYFQKTPDQLSLAEITSLIIIPNRPNSLRIGRNNNVIVVERNKWLHRFQQAKLFPEEVIADALNEPLTAQRRNAPNAVPQFAWRMRKKYVSQTNIHSTIDATIQKKAESIINNYAAQMKQHNVNNAAAIVVNNQTHEVVAYIGSSDFKDRLHNGEVDGVMALRSPGSALKPLLYGVCFDKGMITPKSVLEDVPLNISGYTPENYDLVFRGAVTAEYALQNSLNIPAVNLLSQYGVNNYINDLREAGLNSIWQNRRHEGLSLILGGCTVRLDEMTALYSAFANDGNYYPLQWTLNDSIPANASAKSLHTKAIHSIPILSAAANYMLTQILSTLHRPDLPNVYDAAQDIPKIAWKTGTSYGRKDAWSIGYNKRFTIAVWMGNFSGEGVADLSGAATATPLLFQLFNAVDHNANNDWQPPPIDLGVRFVCAKTGKVPDSFCTEQIIDNYIPGISANALCDHLKEVRVSADEKWAYCTSCLPDAGYKTKLYSNLSPAMQAFYTARQVKFEKIPPHNPACTRAFNGQAPVITSLNEGMTYIVENNQIGQLALSCSAANDVTKVYWYINDQFFSAATTSQKLFFNPNNANVKVSCTDDKGRNTNVIIKVKFLK